MSVIWVEDREKESKFKGPATFRDWIDVWLDCVDCDGSGCETCNGSGRLAIPVKVPEKGDSSDTH